MPVSKMQDEKLGMCQTQKTHHGDLAVTGMSLDPYSLSIGRRQREGSPMTVLWLTGKGGFPQRHGTTLPSFPSFFNSCC